MKRSWWILGVRKAIPVVKLSKELLDVFDIKTQCMCLRFKILKKKKTKKTARINSEVTFLPV